MSARDFEVPSDELPPITTPPLIEPQPIVDTYVSGVGAIEDVGGGNYRLYLYVNQVMKYPLTEPLGPPERLVIAKVIMPRTAFPDAMGQIITAIGKTFTVYDLHKQVPALN